MDSDAHWLCVWAQTLVSQWEMHFKSLFTLGAKHSFVIQTLRRECLAFAFKTLHRCAVSPLCWGSVCFCIWTCHFHNTPPGNPINPTQRPDVLLGVSTQCSKNHSNALTYYCGEIKDTVAQRLLIYPSKTYLGCSSTVNLIEFNWSLNNSVRLCVGARAKPVSQDRLAHVMPVNISAFWLKKKMLEGNKRNWSKAQKQTGLSSTAENPKV